MPATTAQQPGMDQGREPVWVMRFSVPGGSGSEECEGDDGDAVGAAVGVFAGVDDHAVDEAVAELFAKPVQVLDVGGSDARVPQLVGRRIA